VQASQRAPLAAPAESRGPGARDSIPGGDPSHPALAHFSDGSLLDPQPREGFSPCLVRTNSRAGACPMAVATARGNVFYSPAVAIPMMGCDLARSRDQGRSWQTIATPREPQYPPEDYLPPKTRALSPRDLEALSAELPRGCTWHPSVYLDRASGRLFASATVKGACPDGSGSIVAFSDDEGDSWQSAAIGCGSWDWGKLWSGPPATDASREALAKNGFPSVVYFSATGPVLIHGPNQLHFKSLDGGLSWTRMANAFTPEQEQSLTLGFPQRGVVAPDGTIYRAWAGTPADYLPNADKSHVYIRMLRSRDEGASWQHLELPETRTSLVGASLAVDPDGTLYLCWADSRDGEIRIAWSRDGARSWSNPRRLTIPGVAWVAKPTIELNGPGRIALAFWGSPSAEAHGDGWWNRDGRPYSGYVSVCDDIRVEHPRLFSAAVNDVREPLLPLGESALTSGEYIGPPSFGPDGSIWAGFVSLAGENSGGLVARLVPQR